MHHRSLRDGSLDFEKVGGGSLGNMKDNQQSKQNYAGEKKEKAFKEEKCLFEKVRLVKGAS